MNKQNKIYKFLRIVFLTLAIISLIFGLCKKVGLCASSSSPVTNPSLPLRVGAGWGNQFTQSEIDTIVNLCLQDQQNINDVDLWQVGAIVLSEKDDTSQKYRFNIYAAPGFSVSSPSDFWTTSGSNFTWSNGNNYAGCRQLILNYDFTVDNFWWKSSGGMTVNSSSFLSELPNNSLGVLSNQWYTGYPIYVISDISYNDVTFFTVDPLTSGGHSKGGILAEMTENDEITSEELPQVDISSPSDPSSNSGWFQKILNGIGKVNNSLQSGVLTISGYIQGVSDFISQPFDQEAFEDEFYSIPVINDFTSLGDLIEDSGIFDWSDVTPAQRVAFTFDFGGSVLPHTSNEINFDWYTGTIKTTILALISTFLVLGLLVTIINQIPNIISGKSGDKGGGSDS